MIVSMIAAVAENRVIGKGNDLAWNLPDDMKYFMQSTKGHYVIMGRKNYESIPARFRPLSNRTNIIITRNAEYKTEDCSDCIILNDIGKALEIAKQNGEQEAFIIGGGQIYKLGIELAHRLYITEIHQSFDGDTYFPKVVWSNWKEVSRKHHGIDERHNHTFDFVIYERK